MHQVGPPEAVSEFVEPFVNGSPGLTDVHQEVFAGGSYLVEAGLFWDLPELFFCCGEGDPREPGEEEPVIEEVFYIFEVGRKLVGIGRHLLELIGWEAR
jgi:hypothetical protein